MSRVDLLHDAGFKGRGMTIAVIDAGFHNVDKIDAMKIFIFSGCVTLWIREADIYAETVMECLYCPVWP